LITRQTGLTVQEVTDLRRKVQGSRRELQGGQEQAPRCVPSRARASRRSILVQGPDCHRLLEDPVAAAKVIARFAKNNEKLTIVGGALGENTLDVAGVQLSPRCPPSIALRSTIIGLLQARPPRWRLFLAAPAGQLARVFGAYGAKEDSAKAA